MLQLNKSKQNTDSTPQLITENVYISMEIVISVVTDAVLSMFPSALKLANAIAVHQENLKSSKENYRPVSTISPLFMTSSCLNKFHDFC